MRKLVFTALMLGTLAFFPAYGRDRQTFHVFLDISYAQDAEDYAIASNKVLMEWYPKINDILYDPDHALPYPLLFVIFEPSQGGLAYTTGNQLHISSALIRKMPDDYRGMFVHELTHVVQHYGQYRAEESWIVEGIADYVRHKYYEKDIRPTVQLDAQGHLVDYTISNLGLYNLQMQNSDLREKGYLKGYVLAADFLYWLELRKDPQIVHKLNAALSKGQNTNDVFLETGHEPLDDLWRDFIAEFERRKIGNPALMSGAEIIEALTCPIPGLRKFARIKHLLDHFNELSDSIRLIKNLLLVTESIGMLLCAFLVPGRKENF